MTTFVISDIHLGADNCQADSLHEFLKSIKGKATRLIINGDLFDGNDFKRLSKAHWKILSDLRKMSDELELIVVRGNHDHDVECVSHLIGAKWVEDYTFSDNGKIIYCVHGDEYDQFLTKYPLTSKLADFIYRIVQRLDKTHSLAKFLKRKSKAFLRNSEKIKEKALELATERGYDYVCCGHSHLASEGETYFNSGSWTEKPCHFLKVEQGIITLRSF